MKKFIILCIIDGLGLREESQGNGFKLAKTPTFDYLFSQYPNSKILASGKAVGLPEKQMGNSEVGHLNIGAGKIVYTGLSLIAQDLISKKFRKNPNFLDLFIKVKEKNSTLHLMGLLSPGGVHSSETHLFELIEAAADFGLKKVSVHVFGDGRDVAPQSIESSLKKLDVLLKKHNFFLASIAGRFYAMDRDKMFDRTKISYEAILGKSKNTFTNVFDYVKSQYSKNITDEFFYPAINEKAKFLQDGDGVIFFNFRPDRARQLTHFIYGSDLYQQKPAKKINLVGFLSMMKYEGIDCPVAYEDMKITNPLGKVMETENKSQLRVAETQKYAHVTFFMDGNKDIVFKNSKRILIDSLKVESYADFPLMSAEKITDAIIANAQNFDLTILNYANPDMVGHTGNLQATIKAVTFLDSQIKRLVDFVEKNNGTLFITADHGNAELTEDANGNPSTKHTSFPVMLISTDKNLKLKDGILADIAPTILNYMKIKKPEEMTGVSLIEKS